MYGVEGLFTRRRHLEKLIEMITGIFKAPAAVDDAFFLAAFSYWADGAITGDSSRYRKAAVTINVLRFEVEFIFLCPFLGNFFPLFIVVSLRSKVCRAVRANQSAIRYLFLHSFCHCYLNPLKFFPA